jgi:hypothetical protein
VSVETNIFCFGFVFGALVLGLCGFVLGVQAASSECKDAHQCYDGSIESCAFTPHIIGVRKCEFDRWRPCEPDPLYRVPQNPGPVP